PYCQKEMQKKTPSRWGRRPGVGVTALRGAWGKVVLVNVCRHLANAAQFFVSEKRLFLVPGPLFVAQSGFFRDFRKLLHRNAEQRRRSHLRYVAILRVLHRGFSSG